MASYSSATVVSTTDSIEKSQRRALKDTLYTAHRAKIAAAKKQFAVDSPEAPETIDDVIAAIKAGTFTLKDGDGERYAGDLFYRVIWRDPSVKADHAGYKTARADLDAAYADLALKVEIIPVADALTAVETYRDSK